jgi:isoquinoline 1-oxidoreductase beta subunit
MTIDARGASAPGDSLRAVDETIQEGTTEAAPGVARRRFLTWMTAAPTITMVAHVGLDAVSPTAAAATVEAGVQLPFGLDLGDALTLAGSPTGLAMVMRITPANRVEVELTRVETGQGITTTIAMLVADELGARLADVDVLLADAAQNQIAQLTALSNTTRAMFVPARTVAAGVRARLITAAAARWRVLPSSVSVADTTVRGPGGRTATFASLAEDAARIVVPLASTALKPASQFTVVGKPTVRIDAEAIVTGKAKYSLDQGPADALPTVVARPPTLGGTVVSVNDAAARAMPGVVAVTRIPSGVAVTARTFGEALAAKDKLQVTWKNGPLVGKSDAQVLQQLRSVVAPFGPRPLLTRAVEGTFEFLAVSHAPMEVHGAVADVRGGKAEVWCSTQVAPHAQREVAKALGMASGSVKLHVTRAGGAFGRRLFPEPAIEAALVSKATSRPIKVMWTRNDDMRHGRFRLPSVAKVRACYIGNLVMAFEHNLASLQLDMSHGLGDALTAGGMALLPGGIDQTFFHLSQHVPYDFGVTTQSLKEVALPIPSATWRSVYSSFTAVTNEIMVDELARAMRRDPVELRRAKLSSARLRTVLDVVAREGNWGRAMPPGHGQGVAVWEEYKSAVAYLVELDTTGPVPRPTKVVVAADVGLCVNPRGLEAQLQGAAMDAASTIFRAGNHLDNGAMREGSFADFHWTRMSDSPFSIKVHLVSSSDQPGGAGELGYPAASAAMANAYARATGTSPRRFPILG